jgi:hypothetical protein
MLYAELTYTHGSGTVLLPYYTHGATCIAQSLLIMLILIPHREL